MWTMLLKPLIGVAGDAVQNMAKAKAAKAEQKITEIRANTEILNKQIITPFLTHGQSTHGQHPRLLRMLRPI